MADLASTILLTCALLCCSGSVPNHNHLLLAEYPFGTTGRNGMVKLDFILDDDDNLVLRVNDKPVNMDHGVVVEKGKKTAGRAMDLDEPVWIQPKEDPGAKIEVQVDASTNRYLQVDLAGNVHPLLRNLTGVQSIREQEWLAFREQEWFNEKLRSLYARDEKEAVCCSPVRHEGLRRFHWGSEMLRRRMLERPKTTE